MLTRLALAATLSAALAAPAFAQETPANPDAQLYFVGLEDGATVSNPVTIVFGLAGMGVAPAGTEREMTGHHHLLINRPALSDAELADPLPSDDNHRHFGGGQTEVTLDLPSGETSLQLVLGDAFHVPHDPPVMSDRITIIVE